MTDLLVSCTCVTHDYVDAGSRVRALDDVTLEIGRGEIAVVVGPSGSGKSTLLAALAGLLRPDRGRVTLCGAELTRLDVEGRARIRREHVGFVFQSFHLFSALSARANVECVLDLSGVSRRHRSVRAEQALARVGLGHRISHRVDRLSGGERQRVALARAFATDPQIIFGDEPTSALDPASATLVLEQLRAFVDAGRSVVLATHDPRIRAIGTRAIVLEDGRIVRTDRSARACAG